MNAQTNKILNAISRLTQSEGWKYLKRDFGFHIEQLQDLINEPGGNEMKYSEGDLLKIRLKILKDVLEYPEKFISMAKEQGKPEELDPFN